MKELNDRIPELLMVATPIGNLLDLTARAREALGNADLVIAEDTRVVGRLIQLLDLPKKRLVSASEHASESTLNNILSEISSSRLKAVFVSDAGTPGISDPGGKLVAFARNFPDIVVSPIPGVSAVTALLSVAGFSAVPYTFLGFPPHKVKRQTWFKNLSALSHTFVFFESPYRIDKTLMEISTVLSPDRSVVIGRELTKKFEEIIRTTAAGLREMKIKAKGEFVVAVGPEL